MKITMEHGGGGKATSALIQEVFAKHFQNPILDRMEDGAVVEGALRLALTTDSFVVTPLFFPGGDIGRLSVCGTVNDLLMSGSVPRYLTCGFILEEGAQVEDLGQIAASMAAAAREAGVLVVAGDTKVVQGKGGIYVNTSGVGFLDPGVQIGPSRCQEGDLVLVSGTMGDHHGAILSARMGIQNAIKSDCAPLGEMVRAMMEAGVGIKAMRDVTRGGLATVLNELAQASGCCFELEEEKIPVSGPVQGLCQILGLDPLYMGNEGKLVAVVEEKDARLAFDAIRGSRYGENGAVIGRVLGRPEGKVLLKTRVGGCRILGELYGEGLPRIC